MGTHNPLLTVKLVGNTVSGSIAQRTVNLTIIVGKPTFLGSIPEIQSSGLYAIDRQTIAITKSTTECSICGTIGYELVGGDTDYLRLIGTELILQNKLASNVGTKTHFVKVFLTKCKSTVNELKQFTVKLIPTETTCVMSTVTTQTGWKN